MNLIVAVDENGASGATTIARFIHKNYGGMEKTTTDRSGSYDYRTLWHEERLPKRIVVSNGWDRDGYMYYMDMAKGSTCRSNMLSSEELISFNLTNDKTQDAFDTNKIMVAERRVVGDCGRWMVEG